MKQAPRDMFSDDNGDRDRLHKNKLLSKTVVNSEQQPSRRAHDENIPLGGQRADPAGD